MTPEAALLAAALFFLAACQQFAAWYLRTREGITFALDIGTGICGAFAVLILISL